MNLFQLSQSMGVDQNDQVLEALRTGEEEVAQWLRDVLREESQGIREHTLTEEQIQYLLDHTCQVSRVLYITHAGL